MLHFWNVSFSKTICYFEILFVSSHLQQTLSVHCGKVRGEICFGTSLYKKKKRVKKLCSSILKSAVVRCFQCLLWKNIKVFQNDGQILMQSCTGIFDLLFQTKLVDIKQVIKISALSKVQC